jgi:flagellar motor switch protein FliG
MAKLTGPEKAAVLLISLGEDIASAIIAKLDEKEVQSLGNYMTYLGNVDSDTMDQVSQEFYEDLMTGKAGLTVAGKDFIKNALMKGMDPLKVAEIMDNIAAPGEELGGGLDTLRLLDPKTIVNFLKKEHPQTGAIILAHLDPMQASDVIKLLPEKIRGEVVLRLSSLERIAPGVVKDLDEALQAEFSATGAVEGSKIGGVNSVAEIMNTLDHATESSILTEIEEVNPDLAENIRNLMFTFADLIKLDDRAFQQVLKEVPQQELLMALKTAGEPLKDKILSNMSRRASQMLKEDLEALPPQRLSDVEKSQQNIIAIVKRLEDEGKIVIGGGGEELV